MTLNIWNTSGPWRSRREEIVAWIRLLEPDIVCLQEVLDSPAGDAAKGDAAAGGAPEGGRRNQARWLAEHAGLGHEVAYAAGGEINGHSFGNAVLSRWSVRDQHAVHLPLSEAPDDTPRIVLHARIDAPAAPAPTAPGSGTPGPRTIDVFTTHLAWRLDDGAVRERQARALVDVVNERADPAGVTLLTGDLNADPAAAEVRYLTGRATIDGHRVCFIDAWETGGGGGAGDTWDNRNAFAETEREPDRRIDYVMLLWRAHAKLWVRHARVVCDRALTGTFASDHFGVMAEVAAPAP